MDTSRRSCYTILFMTQSSIVEYLYCLLLLWSRLIVITDHPDACYIDIDNFYPFGSDWLVAVTMHIESDMQDLRGISNFQSVQTVHDVKRS